ncbi:MAG: energy transducer TonB [Candidatus Sulfotelmatobacter sp.]
MRPWSGVALAFVLFASSMLGAESAPPQSTAAPQTARQALIEMFFGQAPNHLEKHLPDVTRQALHEMQEANGESYVSMFSLLAKQAQNDKEKIETFDTGSTLFTVKSLPGGSYDQVDVTVEQDNLSGDEDQIELAIHMMHGGKEQMLPFIPRCTFSMKMESRVWRLNEISVGVRLPLADPNFLKALLERERIQNEQAAQWSMRSVNSAEKSYQAAQSSYACALSALTSKGTGTSRRPYLYDTQLASGKKSGYNFVISACDASHYQLTAEPAVPNSGQRAFCSDESGTVRASAEGKAATCLSSGEVVEQKPAAATIALQASPPHSPATQSDASSGAAVPAERASFSQGVAAGLIVSRVSPIYPPEARRARISGTVIMKAIINETGDVASLELISGHPMLAPAAMDAVKQWKYKPYLVNGKAVVVDTQVQVNFALAGK